VSIRVAVPSADVAVVEPVVVPGAGSDVDVCATAGASIAIVMAAARLRVGFVIVVSFIHV
jgi:hypothetical protein